ncbi:hypothetical protein pSalSNUABM01_152 [Salmonella phage pSal-SNUABM-01]|nr:hypothetical protein pSalSNUABM01_152 [Salmonella phage pSal-SNUABM-01]
MRQSAWVLFTSNLEGKSVSTVQREVLLKARVLYRYARPSYNVMGTITCFTYNPERVWVKWDDGKVEVRSLKSLEIVK